MLSRHNPVKYKINKFNFKWIDTIKLEMEVKKEEYHNGSFVNIKIVNIFKIQAKLHAKWLKFQKRICTEYIANKK